MAHTRERILLVENDPDISDLIARQTLKPLGYQVIVVEAASQALNEAARFCPDVILANIQLRGLSGKDLLVALTSQGMDVPVIVIAEKGMESDVIQAFRLGASDYIRCPVREAEVVSAVERVLKHVRSKQERENLTRMLNQTNQELQKRVRELTTIFGIGKAVTSINNQKTLLNKVVEGAVYVTEADCGWLLLRDEKTRSFVLSAYQNLPEIFSKKLNQAWDDGLSSLVALSGEPLSIFGEPLRRFKVFNIGKSALVAPIKARSEVVGLLVMMRRKPTEFASNQQSLLEAVADYASISLVNAHLFKALEERARSLQQAVEKAHLSGKQKDESLQNLREQVLKPLLEVKQELGVLLLEETSAKKAEALRQISEKVDIISHAMEKLQN
jgi:two-component system, NtrC family, sensor kinase